MIVLRLFSGYFLQVIPFAVLGLYPFSGDFRFPARKTWAATLGLILALDGVFTGASIFLQANLPPQKSLFFAVNLVFLTSLIPCFLWLNYAVKAIWQKKLFVFSFLLVSAFSMTSVCNTVSTWLMRNSPQDGLPYRGLSGLVILLFTALLTPLLLLILKKGYMQVADGLSKKENGYLAVLSLALFLILCGGLLFDGSEDLYRPLTFFLYAALFSAVFLIYTIFFRMLALSRDKMAATREGDYLKHQLEIRDEQYRRFNDGIERSRRMNHDLKHHMLTVRGLLNEGQIAAAEAYLDRYVQAAEDQEIAKLCEVPVINWIVSYYRAQAKSRDIAFRMRISTPPAEQIAIREADLAVLLGNLLENAVAAADTAEGEARSIQLNITHSGNMLVVTVDNGFSGVVRTDGKRYLSTKEEHTGIGLRSVEEIAEKYGGGVDFSHEGTVFHSSVMLGIRCADGEQ